MDAESQVRQEKVVLELGGNAAVIIEPDADLEYAAQRCVTGGFTYAGQTCISVQRSLCMNPLPSRLPNSSWPVCEGWQPDPGDERTVVGPLDRRRCRATHRGLD